MKTQLQKEIEKLHHLQLEQLAAITALEQHKIQQKVDARMITWVAFAVAAIGLVCLL